MTHGFASLQSHSTLGYGHMNAPQYRPSRRGTRVSSVDELGYNRSSTTCDCELILNN